jgi:hypothetical protein
MVQKSLWIMVIGAENSEFSITKAIGQALDYMLVHEMGDRPCFGLVVHGREFLFLKLQQGIGRSISSNLALCYSLR